jgi:hypothetical protein
MPVLPDSSECVAPRAGVKGNRLNNRFQYIHKNESVKARGIMIEESVIIKKMCHHLNKVLTKGNRISLLINLC